MTGVGAVRTLPPSIARRANGRSSYVPVQLLRLVSLGDGLTYDEWRGVGVGEADAGHTAAWRSARKLIEIRRAAAVGDCDTGFAGMKKPPRLEDLGADFTEREKGFEPSTPALARRCSTTELFPLIRNDDGLKRRRDYRLPDRASSTLRGAALGQHRQETSKVDRGAPD